MNRVPQNSVLIEIQCQGITILEYARQHNRMDILLYKEEFIEKLLREYKLNESSKDDLWNCLESSASQYFFIHQQKDQRPNPHAVQQILIRAKRHIDGLLKLFPLLDMWIKRDGKTHGDIGKVDRFEAIGINDALSFFLGFDELEMILRQKPGIQRGFLNREYLIALAADIQRIQPKFEDISEQFSQFIKIPIPEKDRKPELYSLKVWATSVMRFWVEVAKKSVKLGRTSAPPDKGAKYKTLVNSEIGRFCHDCLSAIGVEPNTRTPLKVARETLINFYTNNPSDTSKRSLALLKSSLRSRKTNPENH